MIALIADVHGNLPALEAVLQEIDRLGCKEVIFLGDVAGYGCFLDPCVALLRERCSVHLLGNHDYYLVNGLACPRSKAASSCLDYQREMVTEDTLTWLRSSSPQAIWSDLHLAHGGWQDPLDEYLLSLNASYFEHLPGQYFCSAHTHVPCIAHLLGNTYCNTGSVGQPRDGDPRASFAVFSEGNFSLHRVVYDIDAMAVAMQRAGFSTYYYNHLYQGTRVGGTITPGYTVESFTEREPCISG